MTLTAPCDWPTTGCPVCSTDGLDCINPTQQDEVVAVAQYELWGATHKVYGTCPVSVLPCNSSVCGLCRNRLRDCGCRSVPEIRLAGPVASVTDVVIDGVSLDAVDYRIDDYEWLVRLDGGSWPTGADPLDPDGFRVDYNIGVVPPAGAGMMTGILACELAKRMCGDKTCRLPQRVTQVTRQGVSMLWSESEGFGLPEIDSWVRSVNSETFAGAVHSPDVCVPRQITWEAPVSP